MFYYICEKSLADAVESAMRTLSENGTVEERENQDRKEMMKEIQIVIDVIEPMSEPFISKAMPCDINVLLDYEDEFILGTGDELGWKYTYHSLYSKYYDKAINELKRNPKSRRACIALGQGDINFTADPPCLQLIMINIVNEKLEITVVFRSNDGVKAFPMNIQAIAALQRKIANELNYEIGALHYVANNFHAYHNDFTLLDKYVALFDKYNTPETSYRNTYSYDQYIKAKAKRNNK